MKNSRMYFLAAMVCMCFVVLTGCSSSKLVDVWSDSSFQPPSLNKMLVIYVGADSSRRRAWEDEFSLELARHDVAATPSYRLFPNALPDTAQVVSSIQANGFDGVLVAHRFPSQTTTQNVGLYVTNEQGLAYPRNTPGFFISYKDIVHEGYIDSEKVEVRSVDVWATKEYGRLVWRGTCDTKEPNDGQHVHSEIVGLTMAELTHRSIIDAAH